MPWSATTKSSWLTRLCQKTLPTTCTPCHMSVKRPAPQEVHSKAIQRSMYKSTTDPCLIQVSSSSFQEKQFLTLSGLRAPPVFPREVQTWHATQNTSLAAKGKLAEQTCHVQRGFRWWCLLRVVPHKFMGHTCIRKPPCLALCQFWRLDQHWKFSKI